MHSRNRLLTEADRQRAPCIHLALAWAAQAVAAGEVDSASRICEEVGTRITEGGADVDYVEVCSREAATSCYFMHWQPNSYIILDNWCCLAMRRWLTRKSCRAW